MNLTNDERTCDEHFFEEAQKEAQKKDYKLIPTEVLDKIQDITEQEQTRIDSQVSYTEAQLNAMHNQAKHNKRVLILYALSIITQCIFIGIVLFK